MPSTLFKRISRYNWLHSFYNRYSHWKNLRLSDCSAKRIWWIPTLFHSLHSPRSTDKIVRHRTGAILNYSSVAAQFRKWKYLSCWQDEFPVLVTCGKHSHYISRSQKCRASIVQWTIKVAPIQFKGHNGSDESPNPGKNHHSLYTIYPCQRIVMDVSTSITILSGCWSAIWFH
jgi:hypothetical protein